MCGRGRFSTRAGSRVRYFARRKRGNPSASANEQQQQASSAPPAAPQDDVPMVDTSLDLPNIENAGPGMELPVIVADSDRPHSFKVETMVWGMVPKYMSAEEKREGEK